MPGRRMLQAFDDGPAGWVRWGSALTVDEVQGGGSFTALEHSEAKPSSPSCVTSRSPWWVDYNHAPPTAAGVGNGAGYMHMLFVYLTSGPILESDSEVRHHCHSSTCRGGGKASTQTVANTLHSSYAAAVMCCVCTERACCHQAGGGRQGFHTNQLVKQGFPSDFTDARLTFRLRGELEMNSCRNAALYFQIWGTVDGVSSGWTLTGQPIPVRVFGYTGCRGWAWS
jgi:hypothetical protein